MSWKKIDEVPNDTTSLPADAIKTKRKIEYNVLYPGEVEQSQIVRTSETDNNFRIAFDHSLFVAYKKHNSVEISLMTMLEPESSVDQYGNLNNPNSILFEGYWATLGVGDELPINYRLQNDKFSK